MMTSAREPSFASSSLRDPRARVFFHGGRVFRVITAEAEHDFRTVRGSGLLDDLVSEEKLVPFTVVDPAKAKLPPGVDTASTLLEHEKLPLITYPYEWSFSGLKEAALFHLDIQIRALERGVKLNDATAYNIQFVGPRPIFIDHVSFSPYKENDPWVGHRQYCEQFLNPLVLQARLGIPFNSWFRGSLEGIASRDLAVMLPFSSYFSPSLLTNVMLPAYFDKKAARSRKVEDLAQRQARQGRLPRNALLGMFRSLAKEIRGLTPKQRVSAWANYTNEHTYDSEEVLKKTAFVSEFANATKPGIVWDVGCNTGQYSQAVLEHGGGFCIGLESDPVALDLAYRRAREENLNFLPLYQNVANPSPAQGWNGVERSSLKERVSAAATLALAVIHHLVIGSHIPMEYVLPWLVDMAPQGVLEFVPPTDPQIIRMTANRKGVTHPYSGDLFDAVLARLARVEKSETLPGSGRRLIWYSRIAA
jgi:ribosomal protein L11 methylase PrmA